MVTFAVDEDAEPAPALLATRALGDVHADAVHLGGDPARRIVDCYATENDAHWLADTHPLLGAVALAFTQHRPLVLTPDAVWLTIAHGVAQHVRDHAEKLRPQLVRHAGKRLLEVAVAATPASAADWASVIAQLRDALAEQIGDGRARLFECTFSTSTETDLIASRVVLFDAYSPYFDFGVRCICGIPQITVTGTPADWRAIRERTDVIAELGLATWSARLAQIIDEFIATAEGRPNVSLWKRIYNPRDCYGGPKATGWITRLYPTIVNQGSRQENPMLAYAMDEPKTLEPVFPPGIDLPEGHMMRDAFIPGVTPSSFPPSLSRASVRVTAEHVSRVTLVGGLVAVAQDEHGALEPIAGWHLEPAQIELPEVCATIRKHHRADPGPAQVAYAGPTAELAMLWTELASAILFDDEDEWHIGGPERLRHVDAADMKRQRIYGIATLPRGKTLCVLDRGAHAPRWFVCTLAPSTRDKHCPFAIVEPLDEVVTFGTSLAVILDMALATGGDISELADATLARFR